MQQHTIGTSTHSGTFYNISMFFDKIQSDNMLFILKTARYLTDPLQ